MSLAIRAALHRRLRGRVAAITVFAVMVAQLAAFAHEAETRHRWCAEHGVAEELQVAHDHGDQVARSRHAEGAITSAQTRAVHDHEACAVSTASLGTTTACACDVATTHLDALPDAHAPPPTVARATPGLFRLAPKTSPPQAA